MNIETYMYEKKGNNNKGLIINSGIWHPLNYSI